MPDSFDVKLSRFAELLVVHGMNVQPGQFVQVWFQAEARDLAERVGECAYARGAKHVFLAYQSVRMKHAQLTKGPVDDRFYFPAYERVRNEQIVDAQGCLLSLRTNPEPELFDSMPELSGKFDAAQWEMRKRFRDEGINKGLVSWCLAYPASKKAAMKVFPELEEEAAYKAFWEAIFRMTKADSPDCLQYWQDYDRKLHLRREKLDSFHFKTLLFSGPGTNLSVGLTPESKWLGGSKKTLGGKYFTANMPTFEVFTTPDWRRVEGDVTVTRPANVQGILIEELNLRFRQGRLVGFEAGKNAEAYRSYIDQDEGARQVGEVALVGLDSPVAREGRIFHETLYDENAACHIATGSSYATCIRGGEAMSKPELASLGCNHSITHQDVMISNDCVSVEGVDENNIRIPVIENGHWARTFA